MSSVQPFRPDAGEVMAGPAHTGFLRALPAANPPGSAGPGVGERAEGTFLK